MLGLLYFLIVAGLYGFAFWAPQILKLVGNLTTEEIGWATAVPYLCAALFMYVWARRSDLKQERIWHVAIPTALSAVGFLIAGQSQSLEVALFGFALATTGIYAACPVFWTLPTTFLTGTAAASGIALVNSLGNLAGYVGPMAMGWLKTETGDYSVGLTVMAASMLAASAIALALGRYTLAAPAEKRAAGAVT